MLLRLVKSHLGVALAVGAYGTWGLFPFFWKQLANVHPYKIVAHRMVWAALFFVLILRLKNGPAAFRRLGALMRRHPLQLFLSALLIGSNWLVYIYSVNTGRILDASLGYFINPMMTILLGVVILGEKLSRQQIAAVTLAFTGVLYMASGGFGAGGTMTSPWIPLWLAFSFALYGLIRKKCDAGHCGGPLEASTFEALLLGVPVAIGLVVYESGGNGTGFVSPLPDFGASTTWLLVVGGAVTAIPLWLFVEASKRVTLSTLGFLQYISPSLQFLLAVAVYGEQFTRAHAITFGCIWAALGLFMWPTDRYRRFQR
ncbi:MAG: hypothetical protein A2583_10735 [Bdellovibrionales bacterium RIFOXYD1_FULL_53_11]|nr:MAG: hypothetical protein A2583_10735 [Bdellovibrionales bacterium RIFOXYD1_FULL_53_11]